jgi:hypothetical protein
MTVQQRVAYVGVASPGDAGTVVGPWLQELIGQYCTEAEPSEFTRPRYLVILAAALAVLLPALLYLDRAAYPSEPEKQQALAACSRADPAFVRFLASERDACYARVGIAARASVDLGGRR